VIAFVIGLSSSCGHWTRPMFRDAGDEVTEALVAAATSTRPAPCSKTVWSGFARAVAMSPAFRRSAVQSGCSPARIAAAPATCGVAIDVPDIET
jgi:hypothetical protein